MGLRRKIRFLPRQEALHTECLRRSAEMHSLVSELGQLQKAQQDHLQQFALNSADDTRAARQQFVVSQDIGNLKGKNDEKKQELREQLHRHSQRVEQSVAEADRFCIEAADSLSPEEFHLLKVGQNMSKIYKHLSLHRKVVNASTTLLNRCCAKRIPCWHDWIWQRHCCLSSPPVPVPSSHGFTRGEGNWMHSGRSQAIQTDWRKTEGPSGH